MTPKEPEKPATAPELPPLDPAVLEEAARRFVSAKKPAGGWKRGRKVNKPERPNG